MEDFLQNFVFLISFLLMPFAFAATVKSNLTKVSVQSSTNKKNIRQAFWCQKIPFQKAVSGAIWIQAKRSFKLKLSTVRMWPMAHNQAHALPMFTTILQLT